MARQLKHLPDWMLRCLAASASSKTGALLACVLDVERSEVFPRFEGKCNITSDGHLLCTFVGRDRVRRLSAYVGTAQEVKDNFLRLMDHCKLESDERVYLAEQINEWVEHDYRPRKDGGLVNG